MGQLTEAEKAKKWDALESIRGTYGLTAELEETAFLLLAEGGRDEEVLRAVHFIRDSAGEVTERERRVREAEEKLDFERRMLDQALEELENDCDHLREMPTETEISESPEVEEIVEEIPFDYLDDDREAEVTRPRRH